MRYLNILLLLAMIGFAAVQYNDPDALLWAFFYGVPAIWAFLAAFRLSKVRTTAGMRLLWISLAFWLGLVIFYWPPTPGFWRAEVWKAEQSAREGMGLMIAWVSVLIALLSAKLKSPR